MAKLLEHGSANMVIALPWLAVPYRLRIDRSAWSATGRGAHSQIGTHHCQPSGAGSQLCSGRHPTGGVQPGGGDSQVGGTTKRIPVGGGGMGA